MPEVSLKLQEILELLQSLETRRAVERYMRNDAKANFLWLSERCRSYDPELPPEKRTPMLLPNGATEVAVSCGWALDGNADYPKSRRTRVTWDIAAMAGKEALFFPDTRGFVLSENEMKSSEILDRIAYMVDRIDDAEDVPDIRRLWDVERQSNPDRIVIHTFMGKAHNSSIQALPQGGIFRQFGASFVWIDEAGTQRSWRKLLQNIGPATRRLICSGTINENAGYTERCGVERLKRFDGPELLLSEVPPEVPQVFTGDEALRVFLRIQQARQSWRGGRPGEAGSHAQGESGDPAEELGVVGQATRGQAQGEGQEGMILRICRGLHYWMQGDRDVFRIHYRSTPERDNETYLSRLCSRLNLSPTSPEVQVEMDINPEADFGERRFPTYSEDRHVRSVEPEWGSAWELVGSVDYGFKNPTSILLGSWNGHWLRLWANHYQSERIVQWHKAQVSAYLKTVIPGGKELSDEATFERIKYTIGDPTGAGYAAEYAEPPAWPHITTFSAGGVDHGQGLNRRKLGLNSAATLLDDNGCCEGCRVVSIGVDRCIQCGKPIELQPGVLIDYSLHQLRQQLRTLRLPEVEPGQKQLDEARSKDEDHSADAFQYLCAFLRTIMRAPEAPSRPRRQVDEEGRRVFKSSSGKPASWQERYYPLR